MTIGSAENGDSNETTNPEEVELITSIFDKAKQIVEEHGMPNPHGKGFPSRVAYLDYPASDDLRGHYRVLIFTDPDNPEVVIDYSKNISKGKYINTKVRLERNKVIKFNPLVEEWRGDSPIFREPWRPGIKPAPVARYEDSEYGHDRINLNETHRMLTDGKVDKSIRPKNSDTSEKRPSIIERLLRRKQ